jgi:hypothetical protein
VLNGKTQFLLANRTNPLEEGKVVILDVKACGVRFASADTFKFFCCKLEARF